MEEWKTGVGAVVPGTGQYCLLRRLSSTTPSLYPRPRLAKSEMKINCFLCRLMFLDVIKFISNFMV